MFAVRVLIIASVLSISAAFAAEQSGAELYKQECAKCHGAAGEGSKKAPDPLVGEKSAAQLANVIGQSMPEDNPGLLKADDAKKVAQYVYETFYSPDARSRANPPRVELARLTVRQYRNSVADLIASFGRSVKRDERQGLRGEYFPGRSFDNRGPGGQRNSIIDRLDARVDFNFGTAAPDGTPADTPPAQPPKPAETKPAQPPNTTAPAAGDAKPPEVRRFNPRQFCISWDGSVYAPETGNYEFIVRSEHAIQLWVNDLGQKRPVIDAAVRSADAQPLRASIYLLGDRWYSLRMEFAKGKELDKKAMEDPKRVSKKASVALYWKPPQRNEELIPASSLSPVRSPEVLITQTPFPPDDRSYGWERATEISKEWSVATTDAALEAAAYVVSRLPVLAGTQPDAPDRDAKIRGFCAAFAQRAFRRPLSDAEKKLFVERQLAATGDIELAVKRVVLMVLKSPRFLYPEIAEHGSYAVASRLSYALWDSPPYQALLDAAAANKLSTREQVAAQAERMLASPAARAKIRQFLLTWLRVDRFADLNKNVKRFPDFSPEVAADLRRSLELFLDDVVWSEASDFRQLLLADELYLNGRLAKFYGVEMPADAAFKRTKWEADKRAGVLTHPYMLAGLAYSSESSPIHRGVFVVRGLLGLTLKPPPDAVTPLDPGLHPGLTTRERVALQTKHEACIQCHALINPLGFALENFDAAGRFREQENNKPIDVSGQFENRAGIITRFSGAKPLATLLANDEQVAAAFAQQLFQHLVKQPVRAYGLTTPAELQQSFAKGNFSIRKLVLDIAVRAAQFDPGTSGQ